MITSDTDFLQRTNPPIYTDDPLDCVMGWLKEGKIVTIWLLYQPVLIFYTSSSGEQELKSLKERIVITVDCHDFEERFPPGKWESRLRPRVKDIYTIGSKTLIGDEIIARRFPHYDAYICYENTNLPDI